MADNDQAIYRAKMVSALKLLCMSIAVTGGMIAFLAVMFPITPSGWSATSTMDLVNGGLLLTILGFQTAVYLGGRR